MAGKQIKWTCLFWVQWNVESVYEINIVGFVLPFINGDECCDL